MASLNEIENLLNIEIGNQRLRMGKKYNDKNKYYYYKGLYYIVELTNNTYMICSDNNDTRRILRKYCWRLSKIDNYSKTSIDNTTKYYHQLLLNYDEGLVCDHINHKRFDNRITNLRIVTQQINMRNRTMNKNNTSGKSGVCYTISYGLHYWKAFITNNDNNIITKMFNINILGDANAKQRAIEQRREWEVLYGYIGD
jgi:hypothetical protein